MPTEIAQSPSKNAVIAFTMFSFCHMFIVDNMFIFGLLYPEDGDLLSGRNRMQDYLVALWDGNPLLQVAPETLLFPPIMISIVLHAFYLDYMCKFVQEATDADYENASMLMARRSRYARHSLVAPVPHMGFIGFFCASGYLLVESWPQYSYQFSIVLYVGTALNAAYIFALVLALPPLVRFRKDMLEAEKTFLANLDEQMQKQVSIKSSTEKTSSSGKSKPKL